MLICLCNMAVDDEDDEDVDDMKDVDDVERKETQNYVSSLHG